MSALFLTEGLSRFGRRVMLWRAVAGLWQVNVLGWLTSDGRRAATKLGECRAHVSEATRELDMLLSETYRNRVVKQKLAESDRDYVEHLSTVTARSGGLFESAKNMIIGHAVVGRIR